MLKGNNALRVALILTFMILLFTAVVWNPTSADPENKLVNTEEFIRFHVIAHSDEEEDQVLKDQVKDILVTHMESVLIDTEDIDQAREVILQEMPIMEDMAQDKIKESGFEYSATSKHGLVYFPTRMYGNTVFPAGEYETVRIMLGEAKGENWWCLLFPALCFVDATQDKVEIKEEEEDGVAIKFKVKEIWDAFMQLF